MQVCIYEDRPSAEPGLRLLIASLLAHNPGVRVHLHYSQANYQFANWLKCYSSVTLDQETAFSEGNWNVKPEVLLRALDRGEPEVVWIDSDIIVNGTLETVIGHLDDYALVVTEEALWGAPDDGAADRAQLWGFLVGRTLPFTLNSCVLRVTPLHRLLLQAWAQCLRADHYVTAQAGIHSERPPHLAGDQDVLTALLCSNDFADVPLKILRRGRHILQVFGLKAFTLGERGVVLRHGLPTFVHAQGPKPWQHAPYNLLEQAFADTSPYKVLAFKYRDSLTAREWLQPRSKLGYLLLLLGAGRVPLMGLPISIAVDVATFTRRRLGRRRARALYD